MAGNQIKHSKNKKAAILAASVRWVGVEPTRLAAHGPQPCLSANSSTSAFLLDDGQL